MHAIVQHQFGPADVLRLEEVPDPEPAEDQIRIAVEAAGVHVLDTSLRSGDVPSTMPSPTFPAIPGREVAGVVDAVGPGVEEAWLGRRVVAHLGSGGGGYAERAVVAAARAYLVPGRLDAATAVAAIGTGRTAAGILDLARLTEEDVVVVTSAAGGLGLLLLQGARNAGARAVALAGGADKLRLARRFGASTAIDYRQAGWYDELRATEPRLTVVLDGRGGGTAHRLHALLAPGGRMVRFSGDATDYGDPSRPVIEVLGPAITGRLADLEKEALEAAADGSRVPVVGSSFDLADAASAHRALEQRETTGKVVLLTGRMSS
jgi:NADPH2:quinone reductase